METNNKEFEIFKANAIKRKFNAKELCQSVNGAGRVLSLNQREAKQAYEDLTTMINKQNSTQ